MNRFTDCGDAGSVMSPSPELYASGGIGDMVITAIGRFPQRIAFIEADGHTVSYAELGRRIGKAMAMFKHLGLRRGDGVMQLSGNRTEVFAVVAAAYLSGMRSTILHGLGGAADHQYIVADANPSVFISESAYEGRASELEKNSTVPNWFSHDADGKHLGFWEIAGTLDSEPLVNNAAFGDVLRLAYTGGTTGYPKGVMLSNRSLWMQALLQMASRGLPHGARVLCSTPISHGAGSMIVPTLSVGGTFILLKGFTPEKFIENVEKHAVNAAFLVPSMIYKLLDHPACGAADFSSLRTLIYGASPMSPARAREAIQRFGPILTQSYGQTECPSNILLLTPEDHMRPDVDTLSSAGLPYPGVTVALLGPDGAPVQRGEIGELCVRSALVMNGYWNQPELTAQAFEGGWLHTGDMAKQDKHGYYYLVDRRKDMIISGGFNVFPKEIEDCIAQHPEVAQVAVIGVPDELWGEAVKAVVVLRQGSSVTSDELMQAVRTAKGAVATPKTIDFVKALPLTGLGKTDKKQLRAGYWKEQARAIH